MIRPGNRLAITMPIRARGWGLATIGAAALVLAGPFLAFGASPAPPDAAIRHELQTVYERPEFSQKKSASAWLWVLRKLQSFFAWLSGLYEHAPFLYWVLLIGCLIALSLLVGHIVWTVKSVLFVGPNSRIDDAGRRERVRLSASYHQQAQLCAERGEFTEAIRFLFLSLVYFFDESGRVSFRDAYTNREYLRLFTDRTEIHDDLKVFVDTLDTDWYGEHPSARGQYENCQVLYDSLK
jgi:hypothetical protein